MSDTPTAKACGVLGSAARPTAEPPRRRCPASLEDSERGVMVAVQLTTTIRAGVPANCEAFGNRLATLRAYLRRSSRIHFHHDSLGTCSLGDQDTQEETPSGVGDRFGKGMIASHPAEMAAGFHRLSQDGRLCGRRTQFVDERFQSRVL
jgi:hypothetical protein